MASSSAYHHRLIFVIVSALSCLVLSSLHSALSSYYKIIRDAEQPLEAILAYNDKVPNNNETHTSQNTPAAVIISGDRVPSGKSHTSEDNLATPVASTETSTVSASTIHSNVTIVMRGHRPDRLGAQAIRPLNLMAWSHCKGYHFCIAEGQEGAVKSLKFPSCSQAWLEARKNITHRLVNKVENRFRDIDPNQESVYAYVRRGTNDSPIDTAIGNQKYCAYDTSLRQTWKEMILNAEYTEPEKFQDHNASFFSEEDPQIKTIAVHARRGDASPRLRDYYVPDATFQDLIRQLRSIVERMEFKPEVHLFSEDFGEAINWTGYQGLVDHFHLAPKIVGGRHSMDVDLNLRDWKHFVRADILVMNGSFSERPGMGRPNPSNETGLPLTLMPCFWAMKSVRQQDCKGFPHFFSRYQFHDESPSNVTLRFLPSALENSIATT